MTWTRSKLVSVVGIGVVLATGFTILLRPRHHLPRPQPIAVGQTEFPKVSWVFAGFDDPQAALVSFCWASCRPDRESYQATVTPAEKLNYEQAINSRMQIHPEKSEHDILTEMANEHSARMLGFRIADQNALTRDHVRLHVYIQLSGQGDGREMELYAKVKKIGKEWKYDGWDSPPGTANH